jgi:hypothetical protein
MIGINSLDDLPILEKRDWKGRYYLYTIPSSGKFIYKIGEHAEIDIANGVGQGHTCLGSFFNSMNDEERAALLPYLDRFLDLIKTE